MKCLLVFTLFAALIGLSLCACVAPEITCGDACCKTGQTCCGNKCVDTKIDKDNCGQCALKCDNTVGNNQQECKDSKCVCTSTVFTLACGAQCVNPLQPTTCGGCRNSCGPGQTCNAGKCSCNVDGLTACPTGCFTALQLQSEETHCGSCDNKCAPDEFCTSGKCTSQLCRTFPAGYKFCSDTNSCHDFQTDSNACGGCGSTCDTAGTKCVAGQCADDTTAIVDTVFAAPTVTNSAFQYQQTFSGKSAGYTTTIRSSRAHEFTVVQSVITTVQVDDLPTGYELHIYVSQSDSNDRAVIRETSIYPARPATLTVNNPSLRIATTAKGKLTYLVSLRRTRTNTRDVFYAEATTRPAVAFTLTIRENVTNLPALGRVNVNLKFAGMYKATY